MQPVTAHWKDKKGGKHPASKVTDEQRAECIRRATEKQEPVKALAMDYGVLETTICLWIRAAGYKRGWVRK